MNIGKTFKIKLLPTPEQDQLLHETMMEYTEVCNYVSNWVFENEFPLSPMKINDNLYHAIRGWSNLPAHLVQNTFRTITARYKTVKTQLSQKPYKYQAEDKSWQYIPRTLEWLQKPLKFNTLQCELSYKTDYRFTNNLQQVSISTVQGRVVMEYRMYSEHQQYFDGVWKIGSAKVLHKHNKWYLAVSVTKEVPESSEIKNVVGIDRGLNFLAVSYDGTKTMFFNGRKHMHKRHHFKRIREQLQKKNTKSSRRRLRKIGDRENCYMTDVNHCLSQALVSTYRSNTLFVLEDLTGVSQEQKWFKKRQSDLSSWSFYQLETFLQYKAESIGSKVIKVSPRYTSQRCPRCGVIDKTQRNHSKHEYQCTCGLRSNDDRVGAMNIYQLGIKYTQGDTNPRFLKAENLYVTM